MNELLIYAFSLLIAVSCAYAGYQIRLLKILGIGLPLITAYFLSSCVCLLGLKLGWQYPFGLLSPFIGGISAFFVIIKLSKKWKAKILAHKSSGSFWDRKLGAGFGFMCGLYLAAIIWIFLLLASKPSPILPSPGAQALDSQIAETKSEEKLTESWGQSLLHSANRGFVRHLPLVGGLSDELVALTAILNSCSSKQDALMEKHNFSEIRALPVYDEILDDPNLLEDIGKAGDGNLLALYRLQQHDLIIKLVENKRVKEIISGLRPTQLLEEMELE